jgi:anaerobic dimethyl sulfoxide reductase subunit B (iron-sulfur subunit)
MALQKAFYFDASACTGCKACQVACKDKNNLPIGTLFRRVFHYGGGSWAVENGFQVPNNVFAYSVSAACMHCQNPPCMEVCPAAAISKTADGIVLIDQDKCIGCRYCQWACPYGAPQFREDLGVMTKCDFCQDLQAQGQAPACVAICPQRALLHGDLADLRAQYGAVNDIEPLPDPTIAYPSLVITPHKHAQRSGEGTGRILNLPEEV